MDKFTQELLFGLLFFTFCTVVGLTVARYIYLIKKSMIEYGIEEGGTPKKQRLTQFIGILLGLGVGLILSAGISSLDLSEDTADLLIWGCILLSTGLGLQISSRSKDRRGW